MEREEDEGYVEEGRRRHEEEGREKWLARKGANKERLREKEKERIH